MSTVRDLSPMLRHCPFCKAILPPLKVIKSGLSGGKNPVHCEACGSITTYLHSQSLNGPGIGAGIGGAVGLLVAQTTDNLLFELMILIAIVLFALLLGYFAAPIKNG